MNWHIHIFNHYTIVFLISFFSITICAQENFHYIELNSIQPKESFEDLRQLDSLFENKKLIGIGESTHGTSEFTTMRHRIFKYLVEEKGYTIFFLEADVSACRRVNRYIHGASDTVRSAIKEFNLWPWLTEEMVEIVEWSRKYNETATKKIEFIGCDMQLITDEKMELPRYFQNVEQQGTLFEIFGDLDSQHTEKEKAKERYEKWISFVASIENTNSEKLNNPEFRQIKKSIDQWFERKISNGFDYNFRDSCMAANMLYYLEQNPNEKGFYFAHNWHVSKYIHHYKSGSPSMKTAGYYLFEKMDSEYLSLAMLTNKGSFNARSYKGKNNLNQVFELKPAGKKTLERFLTSIEAPLFFYSSSDSLSHLKCTEIGAVYGRNTYGLKYPRYNQLQDKCYDGFFFIEKTTPTKLL